MKNALHRSDKSIICPYCEVEREVDCEISEVYDEGEHEVCCCNCGRDHTVNTSVRYFFHSNYDDEGFNIFAT